MKQMEFPFMKNCPWSPAPGPSMGMLNITLRHSEYVRIGDNCFLTLNRKQYGQCRVVFRAPRSLQIDRFDRILDGHGGLPKMGNNAR